MLLVFSINSFLANGDFCCWLITFANDLDPDQDGHSVAKPFDTDSVHERFFLKKLILKKITMPSKS